MKLNYVDHIAREKITKKKTVKFPVAQPLSAVARISYPNLRNHEHSNSHISMQFLQYTNLQFLRHFPQKPLRHQKNPQLTRQFQRLANPGSGGTQGRRRRATWGGCRTPAAKHGIHRSRTR